MVYQVLRIGGCVLVMFLATHLSAQILHYVDDSGRKIYVDHITKVPHEYRDQLEVRGSKRTAAQQEELELQRLERLNLQQLRMQLRQIDESIAALISSVNMRGNSVLVPVKVQLGNRSAQVNMVLDTGATSTVFHRASLQRLPIDARPAGYAQVASGDIIETYAARFDKIEIGPFEISGPRAGVIDFQGSAVHGGLLGMDFLRQIEYRIDFDAQQIIWNPSELEILQANRQEVEQAMQSLSQPD